MELQYILKYKRNQLMILIRHMTRNYGNASTVLAL